MNDLNVLKHAIKKSQQKKYTAKCRDDIDYQYELVKGIVSIY